MTRLSLDIVSILFDLVGRDEVNCWFAANLVVVSATHLVIIYLPFQ